ncbi:MAG TPA: hypothetical protein VLJ42_03630, partial [Solirubrobacteraceae bacterium]|nr:hypothetical protein [Solirubrobacteraceae bacterium]
MAVSNQIVVSGAREHNLKDISLTLPRDALVVITGLSGSGKSSLAFDTIYAEGQRRYVESLSAYARQFLGQMDKPDVDSIEGLSPAISIDQKTTSRNPRSTVGTVTEIYDYLRLLWSRVGKPHCPICGRPIVGQSAEQIIDQVMELAVGTRFMVLAPVVRGRKGEYGKLLDELRNDGFVRVKIDDRVRMLEESIVLDKRYKHDISVVVDRLVMRHDLRKRLADSIEGLSPAISIDQKTTSRNPRSTVGTVTEIYDYLRLLWARIGHPHCHICGRPISGQSAEQIIDQVMELGEGTRFMVMAPIVRGRKGEYGKQFEELRAEGFGRVKVNGELRRLDEEIVLDKKYKHDIAVVVDRLVMKSELRRRLSESVEAAAGL